MHSSAEWLDADEQELWQYLLTIIIALPTVLDRQLQDDAGISNFEYGVLARLSMAEDSTMRLSDLAHACNSTQPRLSKVMDRFEARGWVARRVDPDNGRYTLGTLTDAGRAKVAASAPRHVAQVKRLVFDTLGEQELPHLRAALGRVAGNVREELSGSTRG